MKNSYIIFIIFIILATQGYGAISLIEGQSASNTSINTILTDSNIATNIGYWCQGDPTIINSTYSTFDNNQYVASSIVIYGYKDEYSPSHNLTLRGSNDNVSWTLLYNFTKQYFSEGVANNTYSFVTTSNFRFYNIHLTNNGDGSYSAATEAVADWYILGSEKNFSDITNVSLTDESNNTIDVYSSKDLTGWAAANLSGYPTSGFEWQWYKNGVWERNSSPTIEGVIHHAPNNYTKDATIENATMAWDNDLSTYAYSNSTASVDKFVYLNYSLNNSNDVRVYAYTTNSGTGAASYNLSYWSYRDTSWTSFNPNGSLESTVDSWVSYKIPYDGISDSQEVRIAHEMKRDAIGQNIIHLNEIFISVVPNVFPNNILTNLSTFYSNMTEFGDVITFRVRSFHPYLAPDYAPSFSDWYNDSLEVGVFAFDNCSNTNPLISNATALNITFHDQDGNPATVNLSFVSYFGSSAANKDKNYSQNIRGIDSSNYCIYPSDSVQYHTLQFGYYDAEGNYYYSTYEYTLTSTIQYLDLLVTTNPEQTIFTLLDYDNNELIADVLCSSFIQIGADYFPVESKYTDLTGKVQFNYIPNKNYRFVCSKDGYDTNTFSLSPVLFATYDVKLRKSQVITQQLDFDRVNIYFTPKYFYVQGIQNFSFMITSLDELYYWGYNMSWPTGNAVNFSTVSTGGILRSNFSISGVGILDEMRITYYYNTNKSGYKEFIYTSRFRGISNRSLMNAPDPTFGMGLLERLLVATGLVILFGGLITLLGQPLGGLLVGILTFSTLVIIGFLPWWVIAFPAVIGVLVLMFQVTK